MQNPTSSSPPSAISTSIFPAVSELINAVEALPVWDLKARTSTEGQRVLKAISQLQVSSNDMTDDDAGVIHEMETYGGSFVCAMAQAAKCADNTNLNRIKATWPEYWKRYDQLASYRREKNLPN